MVSWVCCFLNDIQAFKPDDVFLESYTSKSVESNSNWQAKREMGLAVPTKYATVAKCKTLATTNAEKLIERGRQI